jgi:hypothetical protein
MLHRKLWILGIVTILPLLSISQARADNDNNVEIRSAEVKIIHDADGNTQIETDRIKLKTVPSRTRIDRRSRSSLRQRRTQRSSVVTKTTAETTIDRAATIRQTNTSTNSANIQTNNQTNRIRGNNRTSIQSNIDN